MKKVIFTLALFSIVLVLAACGKNSEGKTETDQAEQADQTQTEQAHAGSLQLLESEQAGKYLADPEGKALYYFKNDEAGKSNCTGDCLANWPAFTGEDFSVPEGFDKNDFDTITREDNGEKQVTYKGFPLYYFVKDQQKGDVNGQGVKDVWFVVNNETTFE